MDDAIDTVQDGVNANAAPQETEWQKRYAGLQKSLQTKLSASGWGSLDNIPSKTDVENLRAQVAELAERLSKVDELTQEREKLTQELNAFTAQARQAQAQLNALRVLAQKAPHMVAAADFLAIPTDATQEALDEWVNKLVNTFRSSGVPQQNMFQGALPQGKSEKLNPSDVYRQMRDALFRGDDAAFKELSEQWYKLNNGG